MVNQSFTLKQFKKLRKRGDYYKFDNGKVDCEKLNNVLQELENLLYNINEYKFTELKTDIRNKKKIYLFDKDIKESLYDDFILRKINHNIKRIYKVKQSNRNNIINQIYNLLNEKMPCYVYRLDIKSFYESINRDKILCKILNSSIITTETKLLLEKFFSIIPDTTGLPRGLNISATLSELYMKDFDHEIINLDGVYYYARFVDDIIIFSTKDIDKKDLSDILIDKTLLNFNDDKTQKLFLDYKKRERLEYLGYEFVIIPNSKSLKDNIIVNIANKKINKIKSRIIYSLINYSKNLNFELLKKRILFLTCTYPIKTSQQKISPYKNSGYLQAGLLYNYYKLSLNNDSLKELDNFLRNILFSKNQYSRSLSKEQKKILARFSFVEAYKRKITRNFYTSFKNFKEITRCWDYV